MAHRPRTTAVLDGDEWVINGTKQFITSIGLDNASIVLITARNRSGEKGKRDLINTFIVPKGNPGFTLMCERCASDAVQIHGGYGLMNEYPVSRYYKQCKALQIDEGTSEIQRIVISRNLG